MVESADTSLGRPAAVALSPVAVQAVQAPGGVAQITGESGFRRRSFLGPHLGNTDTCFLRLRFIFGVRCPALDMH